MRKLALALAMLVATGTSALADGSMRSIKDAPVAAPTWTGTYVGIQVGGAWADWSYTNAISDPGIGPFAGAGFPLGGFDAEGVTGGLHVGFLHQRGRFVGGMDVDVNWSNAEDPRSYVAGALPLTLKTSLQSYGTVRARAGITHDRMLVYATGGFAWGATNEKITSPGQLAGPFITDDTAIQVGWTAGGGVEFMLGPQWTFAVEYKHLDLGSQRLNFVFPLAPVSAKADLLVDEVTLRLSRKF